VNVTVYSRSHCVQCTAQKRALGNAGIEYTETNVEDDPAALDYVKSLGYQAAPVVVWTGVLPDPDYPDHLLTHRGHWSGFNPDRTKQLREAINQEGNPDAHV
jgi:glutaredoxin-like protein NrdH